ncbi:MAG: histidine phosphatase family protein [Acidimicrobiales bacterium]
MTRLLLIRHAQSTWNAVGRWQGQADPPLTELGERQAALAATQVARMGDLVGIASSDLDRAHTTARIVAAETGQDLVRVEEGLRERTAGPWEGLTRREIEVRWPRYLHEGRRPPGYEHDAHLVGRVTTALRDIASGAPGPMLVVTHGGVINALERRDGHSWVRVPNLAGRWVMVTADAVELGERVELIDENDRRATTPAQI